MFRNLIRFLAVVYMISTVYSEPNSDTRRVKYLTNGVHYHEHSKADVSLSIYCYRGIKKKIVHIWRTVYISISLQPDNYDLYYGDTPKEVMHMHDDHKSSWTGKLFNWRSKTIRLNPFNHSCIGIETAEDYSLSLNIIYIDFWKVVLLCLGIILYLAAPHLSSNPVFYYICGVTLGITVFALILVYLISKLISKKPALIGFMVGSWAVGVYLYTALWNNMKNIALNYQSELIGYMFVTGLISFIICYRFGPVTDARSKNLIKWALQSVALAAIFYSSQYQELSVLMILALLLYCNFPSSWTALVLAFWKRRFPPKIKLLTEDEYHEQSARETVKALEELRQYCSSPECKQWRTVLNLREPVRFAAFVEGKSHLTDSEILEYESESRKASYLLTDDSDSD